ncbi:MAG TPA: hypothetical protein ENJ37_09440 [Deltaproteobacteria bacterium]|nr:hypothetical protein [Deltaproteobacteria bacterium]
MRFLYYDRVDLIEKGRVIKGIKTFTLSEEFLRGHFGRRAVVPGAIFVEAMAQLIGWLVVCTHDFRLSAIMSLVGGVKLPAGLRPGFTAEMEGELVSTSKTDSLGRVKVTVDGEEVASMERIIFSHFHDVDPAGLRRLFTYYSGLDADTLRPLSLRRAGGGP